MLALRDRAVREVVSAMGSGTPWGGYHLVRQGWERQLAVLELSGPAGGRVEHWLGWAEEELEGGETGEARTSLVEARLALLEAEEALGETLAVAQRASRGGVEALLGWGRSAVVYRARRPAGGLCALKVSRAGEAASARVEEVARLHRRCSGLSVLFPLFLGEERVEGRLCVWMEEALGEALEWTRRGSYVLEQGALEWLAEELEGLRGQGVLLRHGGVASSRIVVAGSGGQAWLLPPVPASSGAVSDQEALREVLTRWGRRRSFGVQPPVQRVALAGTGAGLARQLRAGVVEARVLEEALARLHVELWSGEGEAGELLLAAAELRPEVLEVWAGLRGAVLSRVRCALREAGGRREVSPSMLASLEAAAASLESGALPGVAWWVELMVEGHARIVVREAQLRVGVTVGRAPDAEVQLKLRSLARRHVELRLEDSGVRLVCHNPVEMDAKPFFGSCVLDADEGFRVEGLEVRARRGLAPREVLAPRPVLASRWVLWGTLGVEPHLWSVWGWDAALERRVLVQVGTSRGAPAARLEQARQRQEAAGGEGVSPVLGWGEADAALRWGEGECDAGSPFLVLGAGGAESLAQRASRRRLGWEEVARCGAQLGRVLQRSHARGLLHGALLAERVVWYEATGRVEVFGFGLRGVLTWYDPERRMSLEELDALHRPERAGDDVLALGRLLAVLGGVEVAPGAAAGEALEALRAGGAPLELAEAIAGCFAASDDALRQLVEASAWGAEAEVLEEIEEIEVVAEVPPSLDVGVTQPAGVSRWEDVLGRFPGAQALERGDGRALWSVRDPFLGRAMVLERLVFSGEEGVEERAAREQLWRQVASLEHRHVERLWGGGLTPGGAYLLRESLPEETLWEAAPLSWEEGRALGLQLISALEALVQAGVRLGWLSPRQVVVERQGVRIRAVLASLEEGLAGARMRGAASWAYAPPEVMRDVLRCWDEHTAVYQVGALLFLAWTGSAPFEGGTPMSILAKVLVGPAEAMESAAASRLDARAQGVLRRALARDPARRWEGLAALRAALRDG